jgi:hypothetical protein
MPNLRKGCKGKVEEFSEGGVKMGSFLPVGHLLFPKMGKLLEDTGSNWALLEV